jgi:1-deoxy-D-xylulose-5-phosphate reductoisomerase
MVKAISILGSTGSVGRQAAECARRLGIPVRALAARGNIELLEEQARLFRPVLVSVWEEEPAHALQRRLADTGIEVLSGPEGLDAAAAADGADCVVTAVSGSVGLRPTLAAIDRGLRIALANKETLVCAGELVMARARERRAEIIPVDSEHSAIFQCLTGRAQSEVKRILLTGSGGPFRGWSRGETASVTPEQAVRHPNWNMGAKISVDSATMMNKGLELIEAVHLFGVESSRVQVLIHPESVVHSMVELTDGSVIAQLGVPDMGLPIQYALTYPERRPSAARELALEEGRSLSFSSPAPEDLPCLRLAMECAKSGGTAPAVLSAANEAAVDLFLRRAIGFNDIGACVSDALEHIEFVGRPDLETLLAKDADARRYVYENYANGMCKG